MDVSKEFYHIDSILFCPVRDFILVANMYCVGLMCRLVHYIYRTCLSGRQA